MLKLNNMSKLVYQQPQDYLVEVSVCSLNSFLNLNSFSIEISEERRSKIDTILSNSIGCQFLMFPEYTFSEELNILYQTFSNTNNCIIIGGSGLEQIGNNFYAYCPVFLPNQEVIKVYKKRITDDEKLYSSGRIIDFPNDVQREIRVEIEEYSILFSVYVCYDFIIENKNTRTDLIFVPQYERSPERFINESDKISRGYNNFVLGANNSNENQRSIGFATINNTIISALSLRHWRQNHYYDVEARPLNHHFSIFYDIEGERQIKFRLNVGKPYSFPITFSLEGGEPLIIPTNEYQL
jgi:hypothetical protein